MDKQEHFNAILTSDQENREKISKNIYDEHYDKELDADKIKPQTQRRKKRISLYKSIVGQGHERILEIGCGIGDLTYALIDNAKRITGVDISSKVLDFAKTRRSLYSIGDDQFQKIEFLQMSGVNLDFPSATFDYVVSTSMIEHLHPEDVEQHLRDVWRILKNNGHYLIWCPNRLGHHKDRAGHLCMFSYKDLIGEMKHAGFRNLQSTLFTRPQMVDARFKIFLENFLSALRIKTLWSHLGVRNILLVATK